LHFIFRFPSFSGMNYLNFFILSLLALFICACRTGLPYDPGGDTFNENNFFKGMSASAAECSAYDKREWVVSDGKGYCIRYFGPKLTNSIDELLIYLTGDLNHGDIWNIYSNITAAKLTGFAEEISTRIGIPTILIARPGTFGSSGKHDDDKDLKGAEARVINTVIEKLKQAYGIRKTSFVGQSGGGHIVAFLLTLRTDVHCAVLSSAPLSLRHYEINWKIPFPFSDFAEQFWDPLTHWNDVKVDTSRRIFVLADKNDKITPYDGAKAYVLRGNALGHNVEFIDLKAIDKDQHGLGAWGVAVALACIKNLPDSEIIEKTQTINKNAFSYP